MKTKFPPPLITLMLFFLLLNYSFQANAERFKTCGTLGLLQERIDNCTKINGQHPIIQELISKFKLVMVDYSFQEYWQDQTGLVWSPKQKHLSELPLRSPGSTLTYPHLPHYIDKQSALEICHKPYRLPSNLEFKNAIESGIFDLFSDTLSEEVFWTEEERNVSPKNQAALRPISHLYVFSLIQKKPHWIYKWYGPVKYTHAAIRCVAKLENMILINPIPLLDR